MEKIWFDEACSAYGISNDNDEKFKKFKKILDKSQIPRNSLNS